MDQIQIDSLHKRYGETIAVDEMSFTVKEGELISLLGPSGCGKTTTLRCIAGIERLTDGEISIAGDVVSSAEKDIHVPPSKRQLGMVFQSFALWPNKSVLGNVMFGLQEHPSMDLSKSEMKERAMEYLETVGIADQAEKNPRQLSGGQQQRVALARALVYDPTALLLDEPLSSLDAKLKQEARIWLKRIQRETEKTMLYVTHDQAEATSLSDRMIIMRDGQMEQMGAPEELFRNPRNRFVANFLGKENMLEGDIVQENGDVFVETSIGKIQARDDGRNFDNRRMAIAISPHEIEVLDGNASDYTDTGNVFEGKVLERLFYGRETEFVVQIEGEEFNVVDLGDIYDTRDGDITLHFPSDRCAVVEV